MAIDHEAVIDEYKEMKTFLQSNNQRQFSPELYSELPVVAVLDKMVDNQTFTKQELDSALARLQWATNCCPLTKPFLQAFWQWKSAVKFSGRPNKLLRGFAFSTVSLRKTIIIQPLMLRRAPGGGQVMQVPQIVEKHTLEVGSATTQTQRRIRFGGFTTRSRKTNILGPSKIASPSVA